MFVESVGLFKMKNTNVSLSIVLFTTTRCYGWEEIFVRPHSNIISNIRFGCFQIPFWYLDTFNTQFILETLKISCLW